MARKRFSTIVQNIYTPNNNSTSTHVINHNLNTIHVKLRVRQTAGDLNSLPFAIKDDWYYCWNNQNWNLYRGFYWGVTGPNTVTITFAHDGTGGYYNRPVDIYALA